VTRRNDQTGRQDYGRIGKVGDGDKAIVAGNVRGGGAGGESCRQFHGVGGRSGPIGTHGGGGGPIFVLERTTRNAKSINLEWGGSRSKL
jgi:hypothetical protein